MGDVNKYIGTQIRKFRKRNNKTLQEVAEYLDVTHQALSRYERGERKTDTDMLFKLADYFNVSINDFFPPINKELSEEEEKEMLKKVFIGKGIMDKNGNMSKEDFDRVMEFNKANKDFLLNKKDAS